MNHLRSGQSLIDVLVASGLGAILLVGSLTVLAPSLRGSKDAQSAQASAAAARGLIDGVRSLAASDWNSVASLTPNSPYSLQYTATGTTAVAGATTTSSTDSGITYSFALGTVRRNSSGAFVSSGGFVDSSTMALTVTYNWSGAAVRTMSTFLTRSRSKALVQTDWSGGGGLTATTSDPGSRFASSTAIDYLTTTGSMTADLNNLISSTSTGSGDIVASPTADHYAWNDFVGWLNFFSSGTVQLTSSRLKGYADSSAGQISFDCATSPAGNICGSSNYYVGNNGSGVLSGYGWSDTYGWISFNCSNHGCGLSNYSVTVNPSTGVFSGYAWNDLIGWISFNGADIGIPTYRVVSTWRAVSGYGVLDSAIIDTGISGNGAQVNGITWAGTKPAGTEARFQIATSNSSGGPWTYVGSDGTAGSYYSPDPGTGVPLYPWVHGAGRYFRYRASLVSDVGQSTSTGVTDVIVRWSP